MDYYYSIEFKDNILRVKSFEEIWDILNPKYIIRTHISNIKGGLCVYIYLVDGIIAFPNLGQDEQARFKAQVIINAIGASIKLYK